MLAPGHVHALPVTVSCPSTVSGLVGIDVASDLSSTSWCQDLRLHPVHPALL